jgi:AraC-like DNA-binding protein
VQNAELSQLHRRLRRAHQNCAERFLAYDGGRQMGWGYERRRAGEPYYWDGSRHSASSNRSQVIFQYTLEGRGEYAEGGKLWAVGPGMGFAALLPSAFQYYLPEGSAQWTFFWFIVQHPFVSERIRALRREEAAVQTWKPGFPALESAAMLFETACEGKLREVWTFEERLFSWLLETERELYHRRYPQDERQRLLDETRRILRERLQKPPSAAELADIHHQERTTFSRKFKATTGISPAAFVTEVRLEEALKLLRTDAKLDDVAASTGFADANHFCKVFRRHFHTSPGAYRRLMLKR